ncbi:hypothetical protein P7C71_g5290, partial [Lecanoromycetidae sp. Uapishka_2]
MPAEEQLSDGYVASLLAKDAKARATAGIVRIATTVTKTQRLELTTDIVDATNTITEAIVNGVGRDHACAMMQVLEIGENRDHDADHAHTLEVQTGIIVVTATAGVQRR